MISQRHLIDVLKAGVARARYLVDIATEFHGAEITTEYLLTAAIASEFIEKHRETKIECLNRTLVNAMTAKTGVSRKPLGSQRTDIVVLNAMMPVAMIEVKIGVKSLAKIQGDIEKIIDTIALLKPGYASQLIGAVVFQVHVKATKRKRLTTKAEFRVAVELIEQRIRSALASYAKGRPDYRFQMHALQKKDGGITERALETIGDQTSWGAEGHATRYHAVIIRSTVRRPSPPETIAELKQHSLS